MLDIVSELHVLAPTNMSSAPLFLVTECLVLNCKDIFFWYCGRFKQVLISAFECSVNKAVYMNSGTSYCGTNVCITVDGRVLWHIPIEDLILQTELHVATEKDVSVYPCPCNDCHGGRCKCIEMIKSHLTTVGRDSFLLKSIIGGDPLDGYPR